MELDSPCRPNGALSSLRLPVVPWGDRSSSPWPVHGSPRVLPYWPLWPPRRSLRLLPSHASQWTVVLALTAVPRPAQLIPLPSLPNSPVAQPIPLPSSPNPPAAQPALCLCSCVRAFVRSCVRAFPLSLRTAGRRRASRARCRPRGAPTAAAGRPARARGPRPGQSSWPAGQHACAL